MWASLITLLLLGCLVLWLRAWQRGSKLALGLAIGVALVVLGGLLLQTAPVFDHVPVWVPALPFAIIAITLFSFGALAWFWGED
ncbi:MAG TPA: hypothetical protein VF055_00825 [Steroidobacteraceae bacterium]|jgi:hypothetical protein